MDGRQTEAGGRRRRRRQQYQSRCMTIGKFNVLPKPAKALTDVCRETSVLAKGFGRNEKSTLVIKASWEA